MPKADGLAIDKEDYELLAEFRYLLRRFLAFSERQARGVELAPQQHQALLMIAGARGRDRASIGEIAEWLQIEHQSAVGLVDRLVADDLVIRVKDTTDHRRVYVRLTAKGWQMLEQLSTAHREEIDRLAPDLIDLLSRLRTDAAIKQS